MMALAEQTLGAVSVVQCFSREPEQDRQFRSLGAQTLRANLRSTAAQLWFKIAAGAVTATGTATVMVVGGVHVLDGRLTVGGLLVFVSYLASLYAPLEALAYLSTSVATASASARRVLEILDSGDRVTERSGARDLRIAGFGAAVRFDGVTFGYDRDRGPVLHEIGLEIRAGEVVALVGATGAGKSTLAALLPRLFDPWSGAVLLDGRDLKGLTLSSVRSAVSVVPQEPFLLPLSVRENIAYADPSADFARVKRAAEAAGADEFIRNLADGYDTILGERGCTLSAGQRQRLAIARALLKDSPVLVLDEPTASLDAQTEKQVVDALRALMRERTCLVIAHRLSTIRHADRIVVLEKGRIVEQGTHRELLANRSGVYQQFHRAQFRDGGTTP
jgi:ATP-binding cassette subfamily B protein/subfamily B ATP-binding cassette protein MsbA